MTKGFKDCLKSVKKSHFLGKNREIKPVERMIIGVKKVGVVNTGLSADFYFT